MKKNKKKKEESIEENAKQKQPFVLAREGCFCFAFIRIQRLP